MNRVAEQRYFAYNDGRYLTRRMDRRGLVREFQYDTLGRNTAEIWYDTAADAEMDANRQNTLNFTYDVLGRMLSASDQFAGYAYNLHPSVPGDQSYVLTTGSHVVDGAHLTGSAACR